MSIEDKPAACDLFKRRSREVRHAGLLISWRSKGKHIAYRAWGMYERCASGLVGKKGCPITCSLLNPPYVTHPGLPHHTREHFASGSGLWVQAVSFDTMLPVSLAQVSTANNTIRSAASVIFVCGQGGAHPRSSKMAATASLAAMVPV